MNNVVLKVSCFRDPNRNVRIVNAPIGSLDDFDDVRAYGRASGKAISRAIKVSTSPSRFTFFFTLSCFIFIVRLAQSRLF